MIQKVRKSDIWNALLKTRWSIEYLQGSGCLTESQVAEVIYRIGQELKLKYGFNTWIPEEDLTFGTQLYAAMHYCPSHLVEAAKLSHFFESLLLANHNLNTVVAATMNSIQPRAGESIEDFTAVNMWYERLDKRYNFSFGPVILPLLTADNLEQLARLDPPYLRDYRAKINEQNMSAFFGKNEIEIIFNEPVPF